MSDTTMRQSGAALREGVERALGERLTVDFWHALEAEKRTGELDAALWADIEDLGLPGLLAGAADGGAQASLVEASGALEALGALAVPAPAAESMLANWCLAKAGLKLPNEGPKGGPNGGLAGALTLAPALPGDGAELSRTDGGWRLTGRLRSVPFARHAAHVLVEAASADGVMWCVAGAPAASNGCTLTAGEGLNGEARDDLELDTELPDTHVAPRPGLDLWTAAAAMRAVQMASALAAGLDLSLEYVSERKQFGRPLAKFQAIQQQLAVMAAQSTVASVAARRAFAALDASDPFFAVASAKVAVGQAASQGAAIAHQVHGAMGFTAEYGLHRLSRRLWTWREEYGNEAWWGRRLGEHVAARGADRLWDQLIEEPGS